MREHMSEEADFDVIIIGCGMAGMACAAQLLKEGVEGDRILVVDRGEPIGGKNMSGGILWGREPVSYTHLTLPTICSV